MDNVAVSRIADELGWGNTVHVAFFGTAVFVGKAGVWVLPLRGHDADGNHAADSDQPAAPKDALVIVACRAFVCEAFVTLSELGFMVFRVSHPTISTGGLGDYRTNSHPGGRRILPTHIAAIQLGQSWPDRLNLKQVIDVLLSENKTRQRIQYIRTSSSCPTPRAARTPAAAGSRAC